MRSYGFGLTAAIIAFSALPAAAQDAAPFGGEDDVAFALRLWDRMQEARLVGAEAIESRPYEGVEPHGVILTTLQTSLEIDGHEGAMIVKNNYLGDSVSITSVADNPNLNLDAVTIMYRREAGYDPETRNWFWAKYNSDGSLSTNPRGVQLAGRISKNPEDGCIACHQFAPGNDYVFLNDRFALPDPIAFDVDGEEEISAVAVAAAAAVDSPPDQPGLNVTYYYNIFNFVDEVREFARTRDGEIGAPLLTLDYNVGSGRVLSSDRADGVGAIIDGFINFPEAGTYTMAVQSNDGVEVKIGGEVAFTDPNVHADRFSDPFALQVEAAGWYPLEVLYFEKRNTSTLELYWHPPGSDSGLNFVPAEALGRTAR